MAEIIQQWFNEGVAAEKKDDLTTATAIYKRIIEKDPTYRPAFINLGSLLSRAHRYRLSLHSFRRALKLKEDFVVLFNIGVLFYRLRKFLSAQRIWERSLTYKKDFPRLHLLLGFVYAQNGQLADAERSYLNVLTLQNNHSQALLALSFLYFNQKMDGQALNYLHKFLAQNPDHKEAKTLKLKMEFRQNDLSHSLDRMSISELYQQLQTSFAGKSEAFALTQQDTPEAATEIQQIDKKIASISLESAANGQGLSSKDNLDLSLLHLFRGNEKEAMRHLALARTQRS